jgi:glycosyltransferase involved in cell wall biosynthesis
MKVSVIIPTYNRANLITEAINSVLMQSCKDIEIIVIDDGSTDNTSKVLKTFWDRIRYIKQKNTGAGAARNRGLKEANGRYIAFLDSDDIWLDFKIELQVAIMEKLPEIGLLFSDFYIRKESGELIPSALRTWQKRPERWENIYEKSINYSSLNLPVKTPRKDFSIFLGNLYYHLLKDPYVSTCSAIVRSSCLNPIIKFDEALNVF